MTCREAIHEVFADDPGVLTTQQVVDRIYAKYPNRPWKPSSISAHLIGLSVNHSSSRHYPSLRRHACLFSLGRGRYRLYNREQDGIWVVTPDGVKLVDDDIENDLDVSAIGASVSLERDLEDSLVASLEQLEAGLRLYEGEGITGQQLDTGVVGRLDILAVDPNGDYVVIELKAGEAEDRVCGQVLRYIGWVKSELAEGEQVRGIIVASDFSERLKYAAQAMPNVTLKRYEVHFEFTDVE